MDEHERHQIASQAEPEMLYHYTTESGLYGILKSDSIWATHYQFLNDLSECQEALELVECLSLQLSSSSFPQSATGKAVRQICWDRFQNNPRTHLNSVNAYLVSFTDESTSEMPGDRLSLWRGYAHDTQGFLPWLSSERVVRKNSAI